MTRSLLVGVLCALALGVGMNSTAAVILYAKQRQVINDNCVRLHRIAKVGGEIILAGRGDIEQFRRDGTLTHAQADRALEQVDERYARWRSGDCPTPKPLP